MPFFNLIPALTGGREKETLQLIKAHADMTYQVVLEFSEAYDAFRKGDRSIVEEKVKDVCRVESKADDLRRKIEENLYSGAFLPVSRSLVLNFAERVDEVADAAQDAARILVYLKERKVPSDLLTLIQKEIAASLETAEALRRSVADFSKADEVKAKIDYIRAKEHECDEIEDLAYTRMYDSVTDPILALLLSKLIEYSGNISDRAEDATDTLSLMLLGNKA
jgi:hypothetical protein